MKKDDVIALSIIAGVLFLAVGVAVGGCMVYAKMPWHKNSVSQADTIKEYESDNPEMFSAYMREMQSRIKSNWQPSSQKVSRSVTLLYSINKDGSLRHYSIYRSSGSKDMDNAAVEALKKSFPFKPLPENFKGEYVDVQFTFDYNVWEKKK